MQIKEYTCQLCGTKIPTLDNMENINIIFSGADYQETYQYDVCPYCSGLIMGISKTELNNMLLNQLQDIIHKDE